MTCLGEEKWFHKNKEMGTLSGNETVTLTYSDRTKGLYHCEYVSKDDSNDNSKKKFYFYVQGKGERLSRLHGCSAVTSSPSHFLTLSLIQCATTVLNWTRYW